MEYDSKKILYLTFEMLVAVLSIVGNALVAFTFLRERSLRTPTNLFVFSLAMTDLLTSAVATPLYVRSMITKFPHHFLSCVCVQSLILTFCTVSIFHLTAVSLDRYQAIVCRRKPTSRERGMLRAISYIACAWILGILVGCLPLMGWNAGEPSGASNLANCEFMKVISMKYLMFLFYATIMAPTVVMIFFYGSIYYTVRQQNQRMLGSRYSVDSRSSIANHDLIVKLSRERPASESASALIDQSIELTDQSNSLFQNRPSSCPSSMARVVHWQKRQNARAKKVIFSLLLVIICFFISWYPLYTMNAVAYYCETCHFEDWWFYGPIIISHMSSVTNPFIYARTMPGYKEAFVETLTCGRVILEPSTGSTKRRSTMITDFKKSSILSKQNTLDEDLCPV